MKQKIDSALITVLCLSLFLLKGLDTFSQKIPAFKMTLSTRKIFDTEKDLPKGKPVVLIYFDPDCDHCQKLMNELFPKMVNLKKAQIILVTYKPVEELAVFEKKYNIASYGNIKAGTEGYIFYLRNYYKIMLMPFTALYDKNGNLNYVYKKETYVDDLINRMKRL